MRRGATGWRLWLISAAAAVGFGVTASLGLWQLSRAAGKERLQAQIDAQRARPALAGAALGNDAPLQRPVVLRGTWLGGHTVYLDNRQMNGKPGFFVLTPLQVEGSATVVVVQRGWAPRNFGDRAALPPVQTPSGVVTVEGRIAPAPARLLDFDGAPGGVIRQNLDLTRYAAELRRPLLDVTVLQTGDASDGLLRQWAEPASGADKHYGYAFQWFGLAGLITILYVWFQIVRRFLPATRRPR